MSAHALPFQDVSVFIPKPVITLTANPLAEFTLKTPLWNAGKTVRAHSHSFQFGGKGLNVAKMAARLGHPTTAIHFSGGHLGEKCTCSIQDQAYRSIAIPTEWETRIGFVVRTENTAETTFLGPDQPVSLSDWKRMLEAVQTQEPASVIVCGSIPDFSPAHSECFASFFEQWKSVGHYLFLDTYGPPLKALATLPFDQIKINRHEWNLLHLEDLNHEQPDFRQLPNNEPNSWIITNGPNTIYVWNRATGPLEYTPPKISCEVSPTGSGDVFLATLQHALATNPDLYSAIELASDYAARNASQSTIAEFPLS